LSGDRYGFRPIPVELNVKTFERLRYEAAKLNLENRQLLEEWYKLDENAVPNMYMLQVLLFYGKTIKKILFLTGPYQVKNRTCKILGLKNNFWINKPFSVLF
jgi:hypothetical protein